MRDDLEKILPEVRKPARYIGNELNSSHKDWDKAALHVALAYPDTYEIGMSNLGIQILYYILNQIDDVLAEAKSKDINEARVEEALESLKRHGEIFEPRHGFVSRI